MRASHLAAAAGIAVLLALWGARERCKPGPSGEGPGPVSPPVKSAVALENESFACVALRELVGAQSEWRRKDLDENGVADYWTLDVAGFHALPLSRASGGRPSIDLPFALADLSPRTYAWDPPVQPRARLGYLFQAMIENEKGQPYNETAAVLPWQCFKTEEQEAKVPCGNRYKFAFCAVPEKYGETGYRTFIVSEEGVSYGLDTGGSEPVLWWPGKDPTQVTHRGGYWRVID